MITLNQVCKRFDDIQALDNITLNISDNCIYGLIGTNGAGKSTLLKILCGILTHDSGEVLIDGEKVFENVDVKKNVFYMSDNHFFYPNDLPKDVAAFYSAVYPNFDNEYFFRILDDFELDKTRKISTLSKGMKKQLLVAAGVSANTKYLLCDETFDGLDPVVRQITKNIFINAVDEKGVVPIIASHNLRELEDICDNICLLHKGGLIIQSELSDMKLGLHKLQCVFRNESDLVKANEKLKILNTKQTGSLYTFTVRGDEEEVNAVFTELQPVFYEILPLSLEEIFISETEAVGYGNNKQFL